MLTLDQLQAKVAAQKTSLPALYGDVDFAIKPERFADEIGADGYGENAPTAVALARKCLSVGAK